MDDTNQAESSKISTSLELEQIEVNLFKSKTLYKPSKASRGVFGGQVISQAIVAATNCVNPVFGLHSLHCYFLLSASPAIPIIYFVERLREGRSYTTRSVKAVQNGKVIFQLMCSFHKPEPWQPTHQWSMPDVPPPEECELEEVIWRRRAAREDVPPKSRDLFLTFAQEREHRPIAVRRAAKASIDEHGTLTYMSWMLARTGQASNYETPYQKCILAYLSDLNFISIAAETLKLTRGSKGPDSHAMTSSLDHSIWYYDDDFCCEDGLLYVVVCPRAASGRAVVHGRLYSRAGKLVAVTCQEGVVRANRRDPMESKGKL
ncbi:Thioesterase/thiol ester dehydrase-isomerase [Rhizopogon vinicolor AM-OR11-026]|uniref:Thioesterase/thiol ester dehydrase-isomerase n=1 Tax=Rhizopogon vinicolor AM-OR11-026 TaxID=1314800 RepID=A0A1B7NJF5_9AGAM|nr:Thioesterase/thiol ester dehydrase-isomerase [Rhizopogon vinicolor AM-OR11-026]